MKGQGNLIFGIIIAIVIAVFAVINVEPVQVNFLFGQGDWPLVLIILGSVLMGGVIVGSVGMYKIYHLQQELKQLRKKVGSSPAPENGKPPKQVKDKSVGDSPVNEGKK
ncbi:MAG: lipopolysaccharide assembly protein LapA domain-containing protein [Bacillus sp. (in: Bacteria)]|nr:lipopolysaccharide assembly protein LapA domain-containing protein [Bacillus sp. (in: firmicutes)]